MSVVGNAVKRHGGVHWRYVESVGLSRPEVSGGVILLDGVSHGS